MTKQAILVYTWCLLLPLGYGGSRVELNQATAESEPQIDQLVRTVRAVWMKESSGTLNPPPGKAGEIGPMQIRMCVLEDVNKFYGKSYIAADRADLEKSIEISVAYWLMYYPNGGPEQWARCHNGGPDGPREPETLAYWRDVQRWL